MIYKSYLVEKDINLLKENICLFYGQNLGLKNDLKNNILNNFKEHEILRFSQDDNIKNNNLIRQEILNISLFAKKKLFFIENTTDKILELIKELEGLISDQKVFLFSDILEKKSKLRSFMEKSKKTAVIPCYEDNELNLKKIIQLKLKKLSGLSPQNINLIYEYTGLDRSKLNNELDKILLYFHSKKIEFEKLEELLNYKSNNDFNNLKDAALLGNKLNTNKLLSDTQLEPEKNVFYINLINQRLYRLLEINKSIELPIEETINKLKPPIFWKDKSNILNQSKKWSHIKIKEMLKKTYNLEKNIKSNSLVEKNVLLKRLLIDICDLANA